MPQLSDHWAAGWTYEHFMGRWSRQLARELVKWLRCEPGLHWLDLGCGTGALTAAVCDHAEPRTIVACDPSLAFIEYARSHVRDPRASFVVASASDFPLTPNGYDIAASLLALNFFPDPVTALRRMASAVVTDGLISACVWDYRGQMEFLRYFWDCALEVDPTAQQLDEGTRFPICSPDNLIYSFQSSGIVDLQCEPLEIETVFSNIDDYWTPLLGGTGPAPSFVSSLSGEKRDRLRALLDAALPRSAGGTIRLRARAWAVCGKANLKRDAA